MNQVSPFISQVLNFRLRAADSGRVRIECQLGTRSLPGVSRPIEEKDINGRFLVLREALHTYMGSDKSEQALKEFAKECHAAYKWFVEKVLPEPWRAVFQKYLKRSTLDGRIEFESEGPYFPIDLLYIKDPKEEVVAHNFIGLRLSVLKRVLSSTEYPLFKDDDINGWRITSPIRLAFAYSTDLAEHQRELDFFKLAQKNGAIGHFHAIGENIASATEFTDLWHPQTGNFDFIHVSTHMQRNDSGEAEIELSNNISLRTSHLWLCDRTFQRIPWLVFLNCCTTILESPFEATGFLGEMTNVFAHGFVATKADVLDTIASRFSIIFYTHLLRGVSVGESMTKAQAFFVQHHNDYSVLAYSLFNVVPETIIEIELLHNE